MNFYNLKIFKQILLLCLIISNTLVTADSKISKERLNSEHHGSCSEVEIKSNQEQESELLNILDLSDKELDFINNNTDTALVYIDEFFMNLFKSITKEFPEIKQIEEYKQIKEYRKNNYRPVPANIVETAINQIDTIISDKISNNQDKSSLDTINNLLNDIRGYAQDIKLGQEDFVTTRRGCRKVISKDTCISGTLKVINNLIICGNVCIEGRLRVRGASQFTGRLEAADILAGKLIVNGPTQINGVLTAANLSINVANIPGNLNVAGNITSSSLTVNGPSNLNGPVFVPAEINANALNATLVQADTILATTADFSANGAGKVTTDTVNATTVNTTSINSTSGNFAGTIAANALTAATANVTNNLSAGNTMINGFAMITGEIIAQDNITFNANTEALNVVGAELERTRIIRGAVSSTGILLRGEGFTAAPIVGNQFSIQFTTAFTQPPVIVVSTENTLADVSTSSVTADGATITSSGATTVNFIAIGPVA